MLRRIGIVAIAGTVLLLLAGCEIVTVAGGGTGTLLATGIAQVPTGVGFDASNELNTVDSINNVVRTVNNSSGDAAVIAGNGVAGYAGDGSPATSAELIFQPLPSSMAMRPTIQ